MPVSGFIPWNTWENAVLLSIWKMHFPLHRQITALSSQLQLGKQSFQVREWYIRASLRSPQTSSSQELMYLLNRNLGINNDWQTKTGLAYVNSLQKLVLRWPMSNHLCPQNPTTENISLSGYLEVIHSHPRQMAIYKPLKTPCHAIIMHILKRVLKLHIKLESNWWI